MDYCERYKWIRTAHTQAPTPRRDGTEQGVGTLSAAAAKAVWLRWSAAEKVWQDHSYNLERYIRARASDPALLEWLSGHASLPAFDVPAALRKAKLTPQPMLPQRGQNAAQRTSGAAQVRAAAAASKNASALLQPSAQSKINSEIEELSKKLAALKKKKEEDRRKLQKEEQAKRTAASSRTTVRKELPPRTARR